jgi:Holliday junction DNA helicase RuvA
VLSGLSVTELAQAVSLQESARLTRVPGIGKKTAERLLLELKGRLAPALATADQTDAGGAAAGNADVLRALLALGYSEREAAAAVRSLPATVGVSEGIRQALRLLARP